MSHKSWNKVNGLSPPPLSSPRSPCECYASLVTFSLLSLSLSCVFVLCVQHSYFIAPDINGLPTIPESVSIHGEKRERKETKR